MGVFTSEFALEKTPVPMQRAPAAPHETAILISLTLIWQQEINHCCHIAVVCGVQLWTSRGASPIYLETVGRVVFAFEFDRAVLPVRSCTTLLLGQIWKKLISPFL